MGVFLFHSFDFPGKFRNLPIEFFNFGPVFFVDRLEFLLQGFQVFVVYHSDVFQTSVIFHLFFTQFRNFVIKLTIRSIQLVEIGLQTLVHRFKLFLESGCSFTVLVFQRNQLLIQNGNFRIDFSLQSGNLPGNLILKFRNLAIVLFCGGGKLSFQSEPFQFPGSDLLLQLADFPGKFLSQSGNFSIRRFNPGMQLS